MRRRVSELSTFGVYVIAALGILAGSERLNAQDLDAKPRRFIEPQLDRCTIVGDNHVLKSVKVISPSLDEYVAGNLRLTIDKSTIAAAHMADNREAWASQIPNGFSVAWLGNDEETAYLLFNRLNPKTEDIDFEQPVTIHRLVLRSGEWLPSLMVGDKERESIVSILPGKHSVIVLTGITKEAPDGAELASYRVTCFAQDKTEPLWSKTFPSRGQRPTPGVFLWASRRPSYATSSIQHLAWLGKRLLVCAEDVQDILCLEVDTGKEAWRLERVWEYQRGFIGPSVWSHFLSRFGLETTRLKDQKSDEIRLAREAFDKQFACAIVAGPLVVHRERNIGVSHDRIFVGVSKGPVGPYSGYLSDCVVYELNEKGTPIAIIRLPEMIEGSAFCVMNDGIIWKCQNQAMVNIGLSEGRADFVSGPGSTDGIGKIEWYRQLDAKKQKAWLVSGWMNIPIAFGKSAFRLPAGGYITRRSDSTFHFPLAIIDLKTGLERDVTLEVPFSGDVPDPETNFCSEVQRNGETSWSTLGPYLLTISEMWLMGDRLRIGLESGDWSMDQTRVENWTAVVDFEIGELLKLSNRN